MRLVKTIAILLAFTSISCGSLTVQSTFVSSEQRTYDAIAPEYLAFVEASGLSESEKNDRRLHVQAWKRTLDEAAQ